MLNWFASIFGSAKDSKAASNLAARALQSSEIGTQTEPANSSQKSHHLPQGPDGCYDEPGKCYRCGEPAGDNLCETAEFYRNVRVGDKYPEVTFEHEILRMPLCPKCAANKVSPGWGYFLYIQKKGYNVWEKGSGPSKDEIDSVWHRFLHPKVNVWEAALAEQQRQAAQKKLQDSHLLDHPIAYIDQYEILEELGRGGFGSVFLARDAISKTLFAIKGLPEEINRHEQEKERIKKNFALIAGLHHPNITSPLVLHSATKVTYSDASIENALQVRNGEFCLVMEFAKGDTLDRWWMKNIRRGLSALPPIINQIANALDFAHSKGILHRDIKPNNIHVYSEDNKPAEVKVLDFGLAAELKLSMSRLVSKPLSTAGTLPYMSPEQWRGEALGVGADIYALAAVAFELLQGSVPFESAFKGHTIEDTYRIVSTSELKYPRGIWREMDAVLKKGLAKKARNRYFSCSDFAKDFALAISIYLDKKNESQISNHRNAAAHYEAIHPLERQVRELYMAQNRFGLSLPFSLNQQKKNVFWSGISKLISKIPPDRLVHANEILTTEFVGTLDVEEKTIYEVMMLYKEQIGLHEFKEIWELAIRWLEKIAPVLMAYSRNDPEVQKSMRARKANHDRFEQQEKNRNVRLNDTTYFVGNPFYVETYDVATVLCDYFLDNIPKK